MAVLPLYVFAVTVAVPRLMPFTIPAALTVHILGLLDVKVILLEVSFAAMLTVSFTLLFLSKVKLVLFKVIFEGAFLTVTLHFDSPPLSAFAIT